MRKEKSIAVILFVLLTTPLSLFARDFHADQPFLLTSAGQSSDVLLVKIMAQKAGLKFTYDKLAKPDKLKGHKTLVLVSGGSTKGLGAAKIDKDQELERVKSLISAAQRAGIKIITIHIGGQARRGQLSDAFNQLTAENANYMIILKAGDTDGLFSKIAKKKGIPLASITKMTETQGLLKAIFLSK